MSEKGKKIAERLFKFTEILSRYDVAHVYGHYDNVVVELDHSAKVSEEDKLSLNSIHGTNDLKDNIWQLHHH